MILSDVIIPSGEKIKQIRKLLGLKQDELTNGKITRNLISYIENGKTRLMPDTAEIIVDCINEKAREQKKEISITAEYLLEDEITQADRILGDIAEKLRNYLDRSDKFFLEELKKSELIIEKWDIAYRKAQISELAGEYYYNEGDYLQSYFYHIKALESYIRDNNRELEAEAAIKLAKCALLLENYGEAIIFNTYSLNVIKAREGIFKEIYKKATFNNALAYKKLDQPDKSLAELGKLELDVNVLTKQEITDVQMLKGNCYLSKQEYDVALNIYQKLLTLANEEDYPEILPMIYNNISAIHYYKHEYEKSLDYRLKSYGMIHLSDRIIAEELLYFIGKTYVKLGKYDLAEKYLLMGIKGTPTDKNILAILDSYRLLLQIYCRSDSDKSIQRSIDEILKLSNYLKGNKGIRKIEKILTETAYYYLERDMSISKRYLKLGLSFQEEI